MGRCRGRWSWFGSCFAALARWFWCRWSKSCFSAAIWKAASGARTDAPAPLWRVLVAAGVTAGLFAALHGRWAEALVAGLVFSLVVRRTGRVGDGVVAHAVANLIVFAAAAITGNLAMI